MLFLTKKPQKRNMKNIIQLLFVITFLFSCNNNKKEDKTLVSKINSEFVEVSGIATYGSDGIPNYINVFAKNLKTKEIFEHSSFNRETGQYILNIPKGKYYIFSATSKNDFKSFDEKIIEVNSNLNNIEAQDWYNNGLSESIDITENQENKFIGKYFYACVSMDSEFENFFNIKNNNDFFNVFYFKDNSTVIHYANIGGWQPGEKGEYKIQDNKLIMKIPTFYSGGNKFEPFGGEIEFVSDKKVILYVDGVNSKIERVKLINFIPEK